MDNQLYLIEDQGKYGFINSEGAIIINPIYNYARRFHEGVAWVNLGGSKQSYDVIGGKWGFIDKKGEIVREIDLELVNLINFSEGLSWVMTGETKYNGIWGIINIKGNWVLEPEYKFTQAHGFINGVSIVEANRKKGYVKNTGELLFEPQFDSVGAYSDGISWVNVGAEEDYDGFMVGGKWGLVDINGEYIVELIYLIVLVFSAKKGVFGNFI